MEVSPDGEVYAVWSSSYDPGTAMGPSLAEFRRRAALAGVCEPELVPDPIELAPCAE